MPMKEVWRTAFSEETEIDSVLIRIEADGHVGWGETAPYRSPQYSPEWAGGVFTLLRDWLSPAVLGRDWTWLGGTPMQSPLGNPCGKQSAAKTTA
jgi:O-succinylbenzoate synthase